MSLEKFIFFDSDPLRCPVVVQAVNYVRVRAVSTVVSNSKIFGPVYLNFQCFLPLVVFESQHDLSRHITRLLNVLVTKITTEAFNASLNERVKLHIK